MLLKTILILLILFLKSLLLPAQQNPFYTYQKDDTVLKKKWVGSVRQVKASWMEKVSPSLKKDYEHIYKLHFEQIERTISGNGCITAREPHSYLQQILDKIIKANPVLKAEEIRLFFTRDWWPNAYSMGDGSIAINAGLVIHLQNEAELAFVLCHELAHYYKSHTPQSIDNYVKEITSDAFQKKLKELSKQTYGVNTELEKLTRNIVFNNRRHSRNREAEADIQAFAFYKKTGYDSKSIVSVLKLLDTIDQASAFPKLDIQTILNFESYPFKKKWVQEESAIFGQMNNQTAADETKEKDSLKTHPDCDLRIAALKDSVALHTSGTSFLVDEFYFRTLKEVLLIEMIEHCYQSDNVSRNLYYNLLLLQQQKQVNLAAFLIARDLNQLYEQQKIHKAGLLTDTESKLFNQDYNQLLRFINRVRLDELAQVTRAFCQRYLIPLKEFQPVAEQINIAEKHNN